MPLAKRALPQAELLHRAIASKIDKLGNPVESVAELIGLDAKRKPALGHGHAHILPLTLLEADGHLDHILIWAPGGLSDASQGVLRSLRKTYMKGGVGEVEVRFAGSGSQEDFQQILGLEKIVGDAAVWKSLTPLVLPRYRKKRGHNSIEGQIIQELTSRGFPAPESIEIKPQESVRMRHFVRSRRFGANPPEDLGYAVQLSFAAPVTGPIAIGHSSHFGLGLFQAVFE